MLVLKDELDQYARDAQLDITGYKGYKALSAYLSDNKDLYTQAKNILDSYSQSVAEGKLIDLPGLDAMKKTMGELAAGAEEDEKVMQEYADAWDAMISSITDADYDGAGRFVREQLIGILDKEYPRIARYSKEWHDFMNSSGDGMARTANQAADSVNRLTVALNTATKAKNAFDAAMERDAENKGFSDYQSAYAAYAEEMEAGRVASRRAMAAAEYLMAGSPTYDYE